MKNNETLPVYIQSNQGHAGANSDQIMTPSKLTESDETTLCVDTVVERVNTKGIQCEKNNLNIDDHSIDGESLAKYQALKILDLIDEYQLFRMRTNKYFRQGYFDLTCAKRTTSINSLYPKSLSGDPLFWFSGFPCKELRDAQRGFKDALTDIKEMAEIVQQLHILLQH